MSSQTQNPKRTRADHRKKASEPTQPALTGLRHPISAQVVCMPAEDLAAFTTFTAAWHADRKPIGVIETFLTQSLAENAWRLNHTRAIESHVLALAFTARENKIITENPQIHAAMAIADGLPKRITNLQVLSMREQRIHKQFHSMLHELERMQTTRKAQEERDLDAAANLMQMHEEANPGPEAAPYNPAEDGFVLHKTEIAVFVTRQLRCRQSGKYEDLRLKASNS